jgi:transposase-like protein
MSRKQSQFSMSRRTALAGGAALVIGGVAAHAALAQEVGGIAVDQPATPVDQDVLVYSSGAPLDLDTRRDAWTKAVADKLGVTPERLRNAMQDASNDIGLPPPMLVAPLPGAAAPGTFSISIPSPFAAAAKAIGISEQELHREQTGGKSIADVARAHNVEPKVVADALKTERRAELDKAVAEGSLPREVADRLKSHVDTEIDHLMQLSGLGGEGLFTIRLEQPVVNREP